MRKSSTDEKLGKTDASCTSTPSEKEGLIVTRVDRETTENFWITMHVRLHSPLASDDGQTVVGYYRVIGMASSIGSLRDGIEAEAADGTIDWKETTWQRREPDEVAEGIAPFVRLGESIWYRSGKMFYPESQS